MRIATFNLENLDIKATSSVTLDQRIDILRPQLERLKADIICLQEVNGQKSPGKKGRSLIALERLLLGTEYENFHCVSSTSQNSTGVSDIHNLVTLSRFPVKDVQEIRHQYIDPISYSYKTALDTDKSTDPVKWDRPFLITKLQLPQNKQLTIINVHLRAPTASPVEGQKQSAFTWKTVSGWAEGYFVSSVKRAGQALEVRMAIDKIMDESPHELLLVCGDFNAEDHETSLRLIIGAEEDTGNGSLASRSLVPLDRSITQDRRFSVMHHGKAQMLDHMLASREMLGHFQHMEVHNETLEDELIGFTKIDNPPDSYHAPVVAEFDLVDVNWT